MKERANMRHMMKLLVDFSDPFILFSEISPMETSRNFIGDIRSIADIAYLFLCIHKYYESFDKTVLTLSTKLNKASEKVTDQPRGKLLVCTLHILAQMLSTTGYSENLKSTLELFPQSTNVKSLHYFCEGIYFYAKLLLDELPENLGKAEGAFKKFYRKSDCPECENARKYFVLCAHITFMQSNSKSTPETDRSCKSASSYLSKMEFLRPL